MCVHYLPPELPRQKNHILTERLCSLSIGGNNHEGVSNSSCLLTHTSQKKGRDYQQRKHHVIIVDEALNICEDSAWTD